MTTDYRDLITRMAKELDEYRQLLLDDRTVTHRLSDEARAALADGPAVPEGKKPTRDELWELWLRLNNELPDRPAAVAEFWEHAQIDARARAALAKADEPAVPQGREPAAVTGQPSDEELWELYQGPGTFSPIEYALDLLARRGNPTPPPADGEVAELVAWLREQLHVCLQAPWTPGIKHFGRAAELLQRLSPPQPVPVGERLPGPEDCDAEGRCWWLHIGADGVGDWFQRAPYPSVTIYAFFRMTHWLPAHALPLPEVGE